LTAPLFRLLATGLAGGSAIAYSLKIATAQGEAGDSKFERLNLGLIIFAVFNTLFSSASIATASGVTLNTSPFLATAALMGLTIFVAWGSYGSNSEYGLSLKRFGPTPAAKKLQDDTVGLGQTLADRDNVKSTVYAAFTGLFAAAGLGYIFFPEDTLRLVFGEASGGSNIFLWRLIGGAVAGLVPALTYTLKEAADEGSLSEPTMKVLNIGLSGAGLGHVLVLAPLLLSGQSGPAAPALLGTWFAALLVSGAGVLAGDEE
jgi:hypothetical protein